MPNTGSGRLGEQLTAEYLEEKGYEIVERNFKCRFGEIDVIAQNDRYLAFVEVKTRRMDGMYAPREAVTAAKRQRLIRTAAHYLISRSAEGQPRFDVVEVITDPRDPMRVVEINHILGAYEAGDLHEAF